MTEHPDEDLLVALALADLDDRGRDDLLRHLAVCEHCHGEYRALADTVDHVLLAAPSVAPPLGFSTAALAAMGLGGGGRDAVPPERPRRRRRALVIGLAAAAVVVGAVGAVVVLQARQPVASEVAAVGAPLVTDDGERVGTVLESRYAGEAVLVVTLTDGSAGATYDCVLVRADGTRVPAGSWELREPAGTTWVVSKPDDGAPLTAVELVADESVWASATL